LINSLLAESTARLILPGTMGADFGEDDET
jgi:hypothetical protein